ncbi:MAG: hypothetical protein WCP22_01980 [Chlamydiota bacterium]
MHALLLDRLCGALGPALIVAAAAASLARLFGGSRAFRIALAAACAGSVLLPVNGLPLYGYFRGVAGDLSVTTLALLLAASLAAAGGGPILRDPDRALLFAAVALAGLVLYPTAAGFTPFDVYHLGYRPFGLVCGVLAVSLWAWVSGRRAAALIPLVALAAFDLHAIESGNLWDYLLDPLVALYACGWWLQRIARALGRRPRPEKH